MRRIIGLVLMGLAGFLLMTALLAVAYVPGAVKKTPLDTDSYTRLTGTAAVLPAGGSAPVKALSHTVSDGQKSDGGVVVFDTFTCLLTDPNGDSPDCVDDTDPDKRLVSATTDRFATDRRTGMAIASKDDSKYGIEQTHEGLINKFPFDVEKKTYPFWDGILGRTVDATFEGEEEVNGWNTYKFVIDVQDEPAEISSGIQGTYSSLKTMWIDPRTGAIQNQTEQQVRKLDNGQTVLDLDFGFTDETIAANIKDAKANDSKLGLVGKLPLITGLLGLLSGLIGFFLWRGARNAGGESLPRTPAGRNDDGNAYAGADNGTNTLDVFGDNAETTSRADIHRR
ncbi:DUF3068 domain-containing protein [Knoellia subterranea]|uniref:DUF3068 domain-containing protein n=1 Tax=Knoellia subterranea KCTC 19937 TaxID=1385521 RepID=A0A0A0JS36_9MICO|nr:DUF3068 domain-containing protein [Knoellia subterranea]KGN38882.1 hypothetical protein N803_08760 [Knoellia subterranea KCTC 19937]